MASPGDNDSGAMPNRKLVLSPALDSDGKNAAYSTPNTVVTSKFTKWDFFPKFLFSSFTKMANAYFLMVSILQTVPAISASGGMPATLWPLSAVLAFEAVFQAIEDRRRHRADAAANATPTRVFDLGSKSFVPKQWRELVTGDIVRIHNREGIPADLLLLASSDGGDAFVETKSLDGETNLKLRKALACTVEFFAGGETASMKVGTNQLDERCANVLCTVDIDDPSDRRTSPSISTFPGKVITQAGVEKAIDEKKVLLRGCVLRNTDFVYGLVLNTGRDSKIMKSTMGAAAKLSSLDRVINQQLLRFVALLALICVTGATGSVLWTAAQRSRTPYLRLAGQVDVGTWFVKVFTYFLLVAQAVPISLYVSMKMARFFQAVFMQYDAAMRYTCVDPVTGGTLETACKVRTMDLNDELGQVSYIFSDKTGTLTQNIMEFRKCSINGVSYGKGTTVIGIAALERVGKMEEAAAMKVQLKEEQAREHAPFVNFIDNPSEPLLPLLQPRGGSVAAGIGAAAVGMASTPGSGGGGSSGGGVNADQSAAAREFFTVLSLCHSVLCEHVKDDSGCATGEVRLSASSPDEQALVAGARAFGYEYADDDTSTESMRRVLHVRPPAPPSGPSLVPAGLAPAPEVQKWEVLNVLEFTSARKRMSVVLRHPETGAIQLFTKGADSEVWKRLAPASGCSPQQMGVRETTQVHLEAFAADGLRTLAVGVAELEEERYWAWAAKFDAARQDLAELERRKQRLPNAIDALMDELEVGLRLIGATAIEDKLQDGVPDAIASLAKAGLNIWVLTGDKQETAINIGFACQLLNRGMERLVVNGSRSRVDAATGVKSKQKVSGDEMRGTLDAASDRLEGMAVAARPVFSLVVDGEALEVALRDCDACLASHGGQDKHRCSCAGSLRMSLLRLARLCKAVVACRVGPKQKALMVGLVRQNTAGARTLSIGDGANDVPMIQTAHIGVGISGQEGMQAVNASDYAIGQFRFLTRLLLVHGRWNYRRMSILISYMIYKNVLLVLAPFWWYTFRAGFSGQSLFPPFFALQLYNVVYTAVPVLLVGVFGRDVTAESALAYPRLYSSGPAGALLNGRVLAGWTVNGVWESLVLMHCAMWALDAATPQGRLLGMRPLGLLLFTLIVLVTNLKIAMEIVRWNWFHHLFVWGSVLMWPLIQLVTGSSPVFGSDYFFDLRNAASHPGFWLALLLAPVLSLARDFFWMGWRRYAATSFLHLVQAAERGLLPEATLRDVVRYMDDTEAKARAGGGGGGADGGGTPAAPLNAATPVQVKPRAGSVNKVTPFNAPSPSATACETKSPGEGWVASGKVAGSTRGFDFSADDDTQAALACKIRGRTRRSVPAP